MEPKLPAPNRGPEQAPIGYGQNLEVAPQETVQGERGEQGKERYAERQNETTPVISSVPPILPSPVVSPAPPLPIEDSAAHAGATSGLPLVANDDDLIEKEWVDKAKKIIVQTKDDPYRREKEVGKLQADYLRKRYGRELGAPE
jgi:hypothetical protein